MKIFLPAIILKLLLFSLFSQTIYSNEDGVNCGNWVQVGGCSGGCADKGEMGTAKLVRQNCPNAIKFESCNSKVNCKNDVKEKNLSSGGSFVESKNKNTNKLNFSSTATATVTVPKELVNAAVSSTNENDTQVKRVLSDKIVDSRKGNQVLSSEKLIAPIAAHSAISMQEHTTMNAATEDVPPDYYCVEFSQWTDWTACDKNCNGGWKEKARLILTSHNVGKNNTAAEATKCINPLISEDDMVAITVETERCYTDKTCSEDENCSNWSDWSTCDKPCDGGERKRTRENKGNSATCTGGLNQTDACNTQGCTVPSGCTEWTNWTDCDGPCGFREIHRKSQEGKYCRQIHFSEMCRVSECGTGSIETPTEPGVLPGTTTPKPESAGGSNVAAIAGGVIGGAVLAAAAGTALYKYAKSNQKKRDEEDEDYAVEPSPEMEGEGTKDEEALAAQEQEILIDEDVWAGSSDDI